MEFPFHGIGHYHPGMPIGNPGWPHHDVIVPIEGRIAMHTGRREFELETGDALVIPPRNRFLGEASTPAATIWVLHYRPGPEEGARFFHLKTPFAIRGACRSRRTRRLMEDFSESWKLHLPHSPPRSVSLLGEALLARMEEAYRQPPAKESPRLKAAAGAAAEDREVSVAAMARAAGLGPSRFRQTFHEHYGMSPAAWLLRQRVEEARQLLVMSALPIKEISRRAGYGELTAFHRAFLKATGATPAAYRKRFGGGAV